MAELITTLGRKSADELGMILPHEHIFVDLRVGNPVGFAQANPEDVVALMKPELEKARAAGVTALVECTPVGVGRRVDLVKAVSEAATFPIIVPTGIYREPWIPEWAQQASEDELYEWMLRELQEQIETTGVQAAWIKLSAGDDGITDCEAKILRAAARAGAATNAVIGSHTIRGSVVLDQLAIIEANGYSASRFIWIHAQAEQDFALNLEVARRGAWIEYDWIGKPDLIADDVYLARIAELLSAGFAGQILLSHDRGWYDPAHPDRTPEPFTYISEVFLAKLKQAGVDEEMLRQLTHQNPFRAFGR